MKRILAAIGLAAALGARAGACEVSLRIVDAAGAARTLAPGREVEVALGGTYRLEVTFAEDHGRCAVDADETELLLEEQAWKRSRTGLPLVLLEDPVWRDRSSREHATELVFRAAEAGTWELEVVRDCSKGGYDETFRIKVS
jgi:hypothetical protein